MSNKNKVAGEIIELLSGGRVKIVLDDGGREILGYLSGKIKLNHIRVYIGDRVEVELDPYGGKATNRVVTRLK